MLESEVYCVPMSGPGDVSEVARLFDDGTVDPKHVVAIMAQTEGDPYCRGYATLAMEVLLSERLGISRSDVFDSVPMLMIGGVGGIMTPHINIFVKKPATRSGGNTKRLSIGVASTRNLKPEELGTVEQVQLVVQGVKEAMKDAGIKDNADIQCVEIKCPAMTPARIADAQQRNQKVVSTNPVAASSFAKGASALGVAVAVGELEMSQVTNDVINVDKTLYSEVASTSAGGEQVACRVVVIGNVEGASGRFVAGRGMMKDQLDVAGARRTFASAGLEMKDGVLTEEARRRLTTAFVNAGADSVPSVRNRRHVLHSDFLAPFAGIQAKAVAHAVVASVVGDTLFLASAGSEHQGPPGSNLMCAIAEVKD